MSILELILVAIALAMDCFAVSTASSITLQNNYKKNIIGMGFSFGLFQGLCTLIGWAAAKSFYKEIMFIDHWIAFIFLGFLGTRMIIGTFKEENCPLKESTNKIYSLKSIITLSIATSIDAMAVGLSFAFLDIHQLSEITFIVAIIAIVSFIFSIFGSCLGIIAGNRVKPKYAELLGGIILLGIGTKILIEHLYYQ